MTTELSDPSALQSLLDDLRDREFPVGVTQYIDVQNLVAGLLVRGQPLDREQLKQVIGPVVCGTPRQQRIFGELFDRWADARKDRAAADSVPAPEPSVLPSERERAAVEQTFGREWKGVAAIAAVLVVVLIAAVVWKINEPKSEPVADVDVSATQAKPDDPVTPAPEEAVEVVERVDDSFHLPDWVIPAAVVILMINTGCFVVFLWSSRDQQRQVLIRRATRTIPELHRVVLNAGKSPPAPSALLRRVARSLRRRVSVPSRDLDVPGTVNTTIRERGYFSPVYASRQIPAEYLVLIDRASFGDQQARSIDHLLDWLKANEVFVKRYYFRGDTRIVFPDSSDQSPHLLSELQARFPDHRLLIASAADGFFDDWTGELHPWVDDLLAWSDRALLCPSPEAHSPDAARLLTDRFHLFGADASEWSRIVPGLERGRSIMVHGTGTDPQVLHDLSAHAEQWLDREPPPVAEVEQMLNDLRRHLGPAGYNLLSACAVFPFMHYDLTLHLATKLTGFDESLPVDRHLLQQLHRLPWFRHSHMPDWLRTRLVLELDTSDETQVREILSDLMVQAEISDASKTGVADAEAKADEVASREVTFDVAVDRRERVQPSVRDSLSRLFHGRDDPDDDENPLRDHIFLSFASGDQNEMLATEFIQPVRQLLMADQVQREKEPPAELDAGIVRRIRFVQLAIAPVCLVTTQLVAAEIGNASTAVLSLTLILANLPLGICWRSWLTTFTGAVAAALVIYETWHHSGVLAGLDVLMDVMTSQWLRAALTIQTVGMFAMLLMTPRGITAVYELIATRLGAVNAGIGRRGNASVMGRSGIRMLKMSRSVIWTWWVTTVVLVAINLAEIRFASPIDMFGALVWCACCAVVAILGYCTRMPSHWMMGAGLVVVGVTDKFITESTSPFVILTISIPVCWFLLWRLRSLERRWIAEGSIAPDAATPAASADTVYRRIRLIQIGIAPFVFAAYLVAEFAEQHSLELLQPVAVTIMFLAVMANLPLGYCWRSRVMITFGLIAVGLFHLLALFVPEFPGLVKQVVWMRSGGAWDGEFTITNPWFAGFVVAYPAFQLLLTLTTRPYETVAATFGDTVRGIRSMVIGTITTPWMPALAAGALYYFMSSPPSTLEYVLFLDACLIAGVCGISTIVFGYCLRHTVTKVAGLTTLSALLCALVGPGWLVGLLSLASFVTMGLCAFFVEDNKDWERLAASEPNPHGPVPATFLERLRHEYARQRRRRMIRVGGASLAVLALTVGGTWVAASASGWIDDYKRSQSTEETVESDSGETEGTEAAGDDGAGNMVADEENETAKKMEGRFDLLLTGYGDDKKLYVIKEVLTVTGLGLKEAKELVEAAPVRIRRGVSREECERIKNAIEAAGGTCVIQPSTRFAEE